MGKLYLVDKPFGENGLNLAVRDTTGTVVLIQDGVYLDTRPLRAAGLDVCAVRRDVERRGLTGRLPDFVRVIDYRQLVDLIVSNKVVNFA